MLAMSRFAAVRPMVASRSLCLASSSPHLHLLTARAAPPAVRALHAARSAPLSSARFSFFSAAPAPPPTPARALHAAASSRTLAPPAPALTSQTACESTMKRRRKMMNKHKARSGAVDAP